MQKNGISVLMLSVLTLVGCQTLPETLMQGKVTSSSQQTRSSHAQARLNQIDFQKIKQTEQRPVVALVLGSGGARGYAHIGAIEVLEEAGIRPDLIVGTSAGRDRKSTRLNSSHVKISYAV